MARDNERSITFIGTIGAIYEKRTAGKDNTSVLNFVVMNTPSKFNQSTNQWEDEAPVVKECTVWGRLADNVHSSFRVGDRVFVDGYERMTPGSVNQKTGVEYPPKPYINVNYAGLELAYNPAHSERIPKNKGASTPQNNSYSQEVPNTSSKESSVNDDIFDTPDSEDGLFEDEPPF